MRADGQTEAEVLSVLERFKNAVAGRDLPGVLGLFAEDADVFLMGSESGETALGPFQLKLFFKPVFARPYVFIFEWKSYSISNAGPVAWASIDALVHMKGEGHDATGPYRITVVLEKRKNRWLLMQYHGSEPVKPKHSERSSDYQDTLTRPPWTRRKLNNGTIRQRE